MMTSGGASGRMRIVMGGNDMTVDMPFHRDLRPMVTGRAMTQQVGDRESRPVPGVELRFDDFAGIEFNLFAGNEISQSDGFFPSWNLVFSTFRAKEIHIPAGMAIVSIRDGDRDVLKDGLQIESGRDVNLNVILTESAGTIDGAAIDTQGQKVASGVVALIPDDPDRRQLLMGAATDMRGAFKFQVVPGDYHLFAWREMDGAAYYDPDFMKPYLEKGIAVHVAPNGHVTMDVKVIE
jgi:hypothetical protein